MCSGMTFAIEPSILRSRSVGVYSSLQFVQIARTRRCAKHARTADATRNGLHPISVRRVIALGASFVCRVENTRWPVSAASIAMPAVSSSRISPIITMFGA